MKDISVLPKNNLFNLDTQGSVQAPRFLETEVLINAAKFLQTTANRSNWDLASSLEYIAEEALREKIICFVGWETDLCKHTNNILSEERSLRKPQYWTGYNYRQSWCTDIDKPGVTNREYEKLKDLLPRDKFIQNFEYPLVRPDDGALVVYSSDFLLVPDWYGEPVRVGFSWPPDYRIIVPGDPSRIIG